MDSISINEKKVMSDIFNCGYSNAATSFSSLTGQAVRIESGSIDFCSQQSYLTESLDHVKDLTVLQTDLIGQLKGASYLIFNAEEKKLISHMSLSAFGSNTKLDDSVILMEIDNIISAAVITEISNAFKLKVYGDVPKLIELATIQDFYLHLDKSTSDYYLLAHTNFIFDNHTTISPLFIWAMDKRLIKYAHTSTTKA